ncbi:MAG: hypothetical protein VW230_01750 [Candidatus Poseidoniales archaeon]
MVLDKADMLATLYQARFEELKDIATKYSILKSGSVETLRMRLISELVLSDWDFSIDSIRDMSNYDLGELLGVFGIKKSGSIKARRQRLYLHLNHDPKQFIVEKLDDMTRDELHALCKIFELPLSGSKQALLARVAGVLASQEGAWGRVKKSLRRPKEEIKIPVRSIPLTPIIDQQSVPQTVEEFVEGHAGEWTFEDEVELRSAVSTSTMPSTRSDIDLVVQEQLDATIDVDEVRVPPMVQTPQLPQHHSLEVETALLEVQDRKAEIHAMARDFLSISTTSNETDLMSFIQSLQSHGFAVELDAVQHEIRTIVMEMDFRIKQEDQKISSRPDSWAEREALRTFEDIRGLLRDQLENILALHANDIVKARVEFEQLGREHGLDLRVPGVSGRLHALFDLHLELAETQALHDPTIQRRNRVLKILHQGAVHFPEEERQTIARLERNIESFEELVQKVMDTIEDGFDENHQSLIIRFLEKKGYEVNTANLRPRILASAGIIGAELGYISPSDIPRIAPGIVVSETEVDAIVQELKALAAKFKKPERADEEPEHEVAEAVSSAYQNVEKAKGRLSKIDEILNRLQG